MYRLILLNNEEIEKKAIREVLRKNFSNIEIVGESKNNNEALNLIKVKAPHIVFVGEILPGESDIYLLKKIRDIDPAVKIIIASTLYHYKEVHQALKIGIMGFLLKPYRENDLVESFNKTINSLEEENNLSRIFISLQNKLLYSSALAKKYFFYELIQGKYLLNDGEIGETVKNLGIKVSPGIVAVAKIVHAEKEVDIESEIHSKGFFGNITSEWYFLYLSKGRNALILVNDSKQDENTFYWACKNALKEIVKYFEFEKGERLIVGVGSYAKLPNDYVNSYLEAEMSLAYLLLNRTSKTDKVVGYSDIKFNIGEENIDKIKSKTGALNSPVDNLNDFLYNRICNTVNNDIKLAFWHLAGFFDERKLYEIIEGIISEKNIQFDPKCYKGLNSVVHRALDYINSNIRGNISLREVSSHVGVNPYYLSRVFKKHIGLSFKGYVNKMKISKAKVLLLKTNYSVNEIAEIVGYEDTSYFCKIFKDMVGKTPNAFRKLKNIDQ